MAIKIVRNEQGNCINFYGSSNPTYWNACLSAEVDSVDTNTVNVINDIITSQTGVTQYEFFRVPYTEFADADNNSFSTPLETAEYITANANVVGLGGGGTDLTGQTVCFKLDDTSTSIMLDNGYSFGVNTIKALNTGDGLITIQSELGDIVHFTNLDNANVCDGEGNAVSGGLNDVINYLNELFTVGAFESVVISDPYSTMIADVNGVTDTYSLVGSNAVDPIGDDIYSNTTTGNYAGLLGDATIDQAGEYFTFDIRGEGQIGFGLVHTQASYDAGLYSGNVNYANPTTFAVSNSAHYGFQFSHWFHPTPNGSWTNYGANTAVSYGAGWYNFSGTDEQSDWLAGNPIKVRVGIDANSYISIETLRNGTDWVVHARSSYPIPQGSEYRLGIKSSGSAARVFSAPKVHLLEPAAPTMYFRYIESPDGNFEYPLFATAEEAEYYDEIHNALTAGTGSSHTHTYADDATNTTWYMPEASHDPSNYAFTVAPSATTFNGVAVNYTEITSLTNADLTPTQFSASNITQEEGTNVNIQVTPQGATWSTSVSITPSGSGLVYDGYSLVQGTLTDVGADTTYTISVTRANAYGSTTGTMQVIATDVAPVQTNTTSWTKALDFSGSAEYGVTVNASALNNPVRMDGVSALAAAPSVSGNTSSDTNARPWATAIVFKYDGNSSNQHIWNQGEGAGSTDDNVRLRLDSLGNLYFGWGRQGEINECKFLYLGTGTNVNHWHGIYIAHNGTRLSGNDATAANLAAAFDIRWMTTNDNPAFTNEYGNRSTAANWTAGLTGARMDRAVNGYFSVGGRRGNRNFHGKVASMVNTTLSRGAAMPTDAEIKLMIKDPLKWLNDHKVGEVYRPSNQNYNNSNFTLNTNDAGYATSVWLMGDGDSDSFANGIRNQVNPTDQNYTKMQLNSMVSNDIETVSINGLS